MGISSPPSLGWELYRLALIRPVKGGTYPINPGSLGPVSALGPYRSRVYLKESDQYRGRLIRPNIYSLKSPSPPLYCAGSNYLSCQSIYTSHVSSAPPSPV